MILLCGNLNDPVIDFFCSRLNFLGAKYQVLDLSNYPNGYEITQYQQGNRFWGSISGAGWSIETSALTGVFVRNLARWDDQPEARNHPNLSVALQAEKDLGLESFWMGLKCVVVNPFRSNWSNQSKPYQTLFLRGGVFEIPKTLISNDPAELRQFYEQMHGQVIHKSASGWSFGTVEMTLTSALLPEEAPPVQLQERITGIDIRVHVVRDRIFATKVRCEAVDYRRVAIEEIHLEPISLPIEVVNECIRVTQQFGLLFSGIDLRETLDGRYYCFEVNTAPDFAFYERRTGQQISAALREVLSGG